MKQEIAAAFRLAMVPLEFEPIFKSIVYIYVQLFIRYIDLICSPAALQCVWRLWRPDAWVYGGALDDAQYVQNQQYDNMDL